MTLQIQLGHPKIDQKVLPVFKELRSVFGKLFRVDEESIYLFWYEIPIQLRYRADLYHNLDAILAMTWLIQRDKSGTTKVRLTTQLLDITWEIFWEGKKLKIRSEFASHDDLYVSYAAALNRFPVDEMSKDAFLSEWKTLLHQIIVSFQASKIQIEDGTERRKWELLQKVERQIPHYGRLYTQPV